MEKIFKGLSQLLLIVCLVILSGCANQDYIEPDPPKKQERQKQNMSASDEELNLPEEQIENKKLKATSSDTPKELNQTDLEKRQDKKEPQAKLGAEDSRKQKQAKTHSSNKESQKTLSNSKTEENGLPEKQSDQSKKQTNDISGGKELDKNADALTERYNVQNSFQEELPTTLNSDSDNDEKITAKAEKEFEAESGVGNGKEDKSSSLLYENDSLEKGQIEERSYDDEINTMEDYSHNHNNIQEGEGVVIDYQGRVTDKRTKRFWNLQRPKKIE